VLRLNQNIKPNSPSNSQGELGARPVGRMVRNSELIA
jgi:hypothetical protein